MRIPQVASDVGWSAELFFQRRPLVLAGKRLRGNSNLRRGQSPAHASLPQRPRTSHRAHPRPQSTAATMRARGAGLQDFRRVEKAIHHRQVPSKSAVCFEALMGEQHFATGTEKQHLLFSRLSRAFSRDPCTGEYEHYLAVVLKSVYDGPGMFTVKRPPMQLVIVLDTSGSMGARFRDAGGERSGKTMNKIEVAKDSISGLIGTLQPEDSISVVTFNDQAEVVLPLTQIKQLDVQDARDKIARIRAYGGTSLSEGMETARNILSTATQELKGDSMDEGWVLTAEQKFQNSRLYPEPAVINRVVFLTDMLPNQGKTAWHNLYTLTAEMAEQQAFFSTFVGVGIDFSDDLYERLGQLRGCNALSVFSAEEFTRLIQNGLPYLITPIAHDVSLKLKSDHYRVSRVVGCPGQWGRWKETVDNHDIATGKDPTDDDKSDDDFLVFHLPSVFASPHRENTTQARGGIVLLKLEKVGKQGADGDVEGKDVARDDDDGASLLRVEMGFLDPVGARHTQRTEINFAYENVKEAQGMVSWVMLGDPTHVEQPQNDMEYSIVDSSNLAGGMPAPTNPFLKNGTDWSVYDDNCVRKALLLLRFSDYLSEWIEAVGRIFVLTDFQMMKFTKLLEHLNTEMAAMAKETGTGADEELSATASTLQLLMSTAFRGYA